MDSSHEFSTVSLRLTDGFTGGPAVGVQVRMLMLTTADNNNVVIIKKLPYKLVAYATTDTTGTATFGLWPDPDESYIVVLDGGWSNAESAEFDPVLVWQDRATQHSIVLCEHPALPATFDEEVGSLLKQTSEVRILVLQGMHYGNQSAALELIRNLRRRGYHGPISVMCDDQPLPYETTYKVQIDCYDTTNDAQRCLSVCNALAGLYSAPTITSVADSSPIIMTCDVNMIAQNVEAYEQDPAQLAAVLAANGLPCDVLVTDPTNFKISVRSANAPAQGTAATRKISLSLTITSISEVSIVAKLDKLEPARKTLEIYKDVIWLTGDRFPVTDNPTVLGMMASGEYSLRDHGDPIAQRLGTSCVLTLQPSNWKLNDRYARVNGQTTLLCLPMASSYLTGPVEIEDVDGFIRDAITDVGTAKGLSSLLRAVRKREVDLMVIYGLHQIRGASAEELLANVRRVLRAMKSTRPCVVLTIYKYPLGGDFAGLPALTDFVKIEPTTDGPCFLHEQSTVPAVVFQLLCQSATLPMIVGGANTSNMVRMLGIPHLSMEGGEPFIVPNCDGHRFVHQLQGLLCAPSMDEQAVEILVKFMMMAHEAPDEVAEAYFALLRKWLNDPHRDQLALALYRLSRLLGRH